MMHTYNGEPILACGHTESHHQQQRGTVLCLSAVKMHVGACREIRLPDAVEYRTALRAALALIDEFKDGHKGQWTVPEVLRLAEIRALVAGRG
jgi:hypothetical protein